MKFSIKTLAMKYIHLFILGLLPLFTIGCQAFEEDSEVPSTQKAERTVRFPLDILGGKQLGSTTRAIVDPSELTGTTEENEVDNVVLAGVAQSEFNKAGKYLQIQSGNLNRSFYFAANLSSVDQDKVKASSTPEVLELNTLDYLGVDGQLKAGSHIPMVAAIDQVKYSDFNSLGGAVQSLLVYNNLVKFTRAFAKVNLEFDVPTAYTITTVQVINVPKKFALGDALADYDEKSEAAYGYETYNLTSVVSTVTPGKKSVSFYLPEHAVKNPVKNDPDTHKMTCVLITYQANGKSHYHYVRIGFDSEFDTTYAYGKEGKVLRNFVFKRTTTLDPTKDNDKAPF